MFVCGKIYVDIIDPNISIYSINEIVRRGREFALEHFSEVGIPDQIRPEIGENHLAIDDQLFNPVEIFQKYTVVGCEILLDILRKLIILLMFENYCRVVDRRRALLAGFEGFTANLKFINLLCFVMIIGQLLNDSYIIFSQKKCSIC